MYKSISWLVKKDFNGTIHFSLWFRVYDYSFYNTTISRNFSLLMPRWTEVRRVDKRLNFVFLLFSVILCGQNCALTIFKAQFWFLVFWKPSIYVPWSNRYFENLHLWYKNAKTGSRSCSVVDWKNIMILTMLSSSLYVVHLPGGSKSFGLCGFGKETSIGASLSVLACK